MSKAKPSKARTRILIVDDHPMMRQGLAALINNEKDLSVCGEAESSAQAMDAIAEVGPGTPMGELLRRYWHPIGMAADATDTPRKVRVLGEDLILFRDQSGRPGLVYPHCAHRGTSLYYGKVEERGIRCCYHGWLFDVQGHCLDQPCEPGGGKARDKVRQPWYPVQELYGLIWAYMGPPERKPVLPRYACLDVLDEGELLEADDSSSLEYSRWKPSSA